MSRNLVICCDGTNNQFGPENTNVVRLVQVLDRDRAQQRLYYDPGVGTLPEPRMLTRVGKKASEWWGLAFGSGLTSNVEEAYGYLMEMWKPGDRVFLFGFSRGAYTARVLAGLLHHLGLLPRANQNLVPYVMRLFSAVRKEDRRAEADQRSKYWKLCEAFRWTFARPVPDTGDSRRFKVHFLGVWDTVSSVGWVWEPLSFPYSTRNPGIEVVRHAVAVDERRSFFRQNLMRQADHQDFQELWFPGVHSDVGGGYPEKDGGLWRPPFEWLLREAEKAGLRTDPERLRRVLSRTAASASPWTDEQHESLTWKWWPAELFPKRVWHRESSRRRMTFNRGRRRHVHDGAAIHFSTLRRIRERKDYAPRNLSADFLDQVRGLSEVPETLAFPSPPPAAR
jgi:uncharacterized protein (DUF2235 family)